MKIAIFSDIHQDWQALSRILEKKADIFICLGDLSIRLEGLEEAGKRLSFLKEKLWLVPGNHETVDRIEDLCSKYGFINFHRKAIKKDQYTLAAVGLNIFSPFNLPGETSEEQMEKWLNDYRDLTDLILFTHAPPKNSKLDVLPNGEHIGCQALKTFIESSLPKFHFSGHVHENEGKNEVIGKTKCFSIGKQGCHFHLRGGILETPLVG